MILIKIATSLFSDFFDFSIQKTIHSASSHVLITYDLFNTLRNGQDILNLEKFEIIDIYLLEMILDLGRYHRKYFSDLKLVPECGIKKHIHSFSSQNSGPKNSSCFLSDDFVDWVIGYSRYLKEEAKKREVWEHYRNIEIPFAISLLHLSRKGITLDNRQMSKIGSNINEAKQRIYFAFDSNNLCGSDLKDLNDWINAYGFNDFFPAGRDNLRLEDISLLEDQHQVFKIFARHEKIKRIEHFINRYRHLSVVFPKFMILGSSTARCTSRDPNIMGIPKAFRPVIVPSNENYGIVECDYAQMEVGIIGALSRDRNLIYDFNNSDVYQTVGEFLFKGKDDASRKKAKIIFLGILYGLSKKTLAKRLNQDLNSTEALFRSLFSRYRSLQRYLTSIEESGKKLGYAQNITGLKRYRFKKDIEPTFWEKNWFKNFPVQASASSVFKNSIILINDLLKSKDFNLLVPHYDAIVFEAPLNQLEDRINDVKSCMITSMQMFFPDLIPRIKVNDRNPACWNEPGSDNSLEQLINNPLFDINIKTNRSNNINWLEYL